MRIRWPLCCVEVLASARFSSTKAFDKVQHVTLFEVFQELDVNGKDLELIKNLYWQQQASARIGQDMSDWVNIARDVRQGCNFITSTLLTIHRDGNEENQPYVWISHWH